MYLFFYFSSLYTDVFYASTVISFTVIKVLSYDVINCVSVRRTYQFQSSKNSEMLKIYNFYVNFMHFKRENVLFCFFLPGICCLLFKWYLGEHSQPQCCYLPTEPGIREDRLSYPASAVFRWLGSRCMCPVVTWKAKGENEGSVETGEPILNNTWLSLCCQTITGPSLGFS